MYVTLLFCVCLLLAAPITRGVPHPDASMYRLLQIRHCQQQEPRATRIVQHSKVETEGKPVQMRAQMAPISVASGALEAVDCMHVFTTMCKAAGGSLSTAELAISPNQVRAFNYFHLLLPVASRIGFSRPVENSSMPPIQLLWARELSLPCSRSDAIGWNLTLA
jgi:hypothetical protein